VPDDPGGLEMGEVLRALQAARDVVSTVAQIDIATRGIEDLNDKVSEAAEKVRHLTRAELVCALTYTATGAITAAGNATTLLGGIDDMIEGTVRVDVERDVRDDEQD
jgi:hypothetical protein